MLKPIDKRVANNIAYLMEYLVSPKRATPNNEIQQMGASIGLLSAILDGKLVICEEVPEQPPADPDKIEGTPES